MSIFKNNEDKPTNNNSGFRFIANSTIKANAAKNANQEDVVNQKNPPIEHELTDPKVMNAFEKQLDNKNGITLNTGSDKTKHTSGGGLGDIDDSQNFIKEFMEQDEPYKDYVDQLKNVDLDIQPDYDTDNVLDITDETIDVIVDDIKNLESVMSTTDFLFEEADEQNTTFSTILRDTNEIFVKLTGSPLGGLECVGYVSFSVLDIATCQVTHYRNILLEEYKNINTTEGVVVIDKCECSADLLVDSNPQKYEEALQKAGDIHGLTCLEEETQKCCYTYQYSDTNLPYNSVNDYVHRKGSGLAILYGRGCYDTDDQVNCNRKFAENHLKDELNPRYTDIRGVWHQESLQDCEDCKDIVYYDENGNATSVSDGSYLDASVWCLGEHPYTPGRKTCEKCTYQQCYDRLGKSFGASESSESRCKAQEEAPSGQSCCVPYEYANNIDDWRSGNRERDSFCVPATSTRGCSVSILRRWYYNKIQQYGGRVLAGQYHEPLFNEASYNQVACTSKNYGCHEDMEPVYCLKRVFDGVKTRHSCISTSKDDCLERWSGVVYVNEDECEAASEDSSSSSNGACCYKAKNPYTGKLQSYCIEAGSLELCKKAAKLDNRSGVPLAYAWKGPGTKCKGYETTEMCCGSFGASGEGKAKNTRTSCVAADEEEGFCFRYGSGHCYRSTRSRCQPPLHHFYSEIRDCIQYHQIPPPPPTTLES